MATSHAAPRRVVAETEGRGVPEHRAARAPSAPLTRARPAISSVRPLVDGGRRPAKAAVGDLVTVEADIFLDGHDELACDVRARLEGEHHWATAPMVSLGNDRWRASFPAETVGLYRFAIQAKVDRFATWRRDLRARADAGQELGVELQVGADLLAAGADRATSTGQRLLVQAAAALREAEGRLEAPLGGDMSEWTGGTTVGDLIFSDVVGHLMRTCCDPELSAMSEVFAVLVEREAARFSTWYEMFPRSASTDPTRPGTFADVVARLPYVAHMGFDVLYLPPIHPIGRSGRKGRDGATQAQPEDPGSPWAIGSVEGGHRAIHPELGTLEEFRELVAAAAARGIEVAIDLAFQASPDHPWVTEHPQWFRHRPDGSIRYAENPPKRYEDIYPLNFDTADWQALWAELREVVLFWVAQGVTIFRVDNPHTKPFDFWEWLIRQVRAQHPEVIFLAEAFTRPRVMEQLAKVGFSQSYTYFAWRSTKWEIESYLTELTRTDVADYFRPNFWPNTPDILTEELQEGGRAAFLTRLVLAATLTANYGVYGPPFELREHAPRHRGSEEYLHSEKYEVRCWDLAGPQSLAELVARVNAIRRSHGALQFNDTLRFHRVDNDQITAYSKVRALPPGERAGGVNGQDVIVAIVSLDHGYPQSGWVELDLEELGVDPSRPYVMHDLLTGARYRWQGRRNFVAFDPAGLPAHLCAVEQPAPAAANGAR